MAGVVSALMQWTSIEWVAGQASSGNALPLVTWSLLVFAVGFLAAATRERRKRGDVPKRIIARGFSEDVKEAAREALESDGMVPVGRFELSMVAFSRCHPGVFGFSDPIECVGSGSAYQLTPEWRAYLQRHKRYLK